jgi:hypothetical protein
MRGAVGTVIAFLVFLAPPARADELPTKEACVDAYRSSQELSRDGSLLRSRTSLLLCGRDPCSPVLQKDCVAWLAELEPRIPSLIITLKNGLGHDVANARVLIDGVEVSPRIDGRAFDVDPGEHRSRVEPLDRAPSEALEQTIVAREREKARVIAFELKMAKQTEVGPPAPAQPTGDVTRALPWTFWAVGGVGVVGAGVFGVFGVRGLVQRSDLDDCRPTCDTARIDRAKTSFLVADVSLVVALVAAGVDTWLWFSSRAGPRPSSALGAAR